MRCGGACAVLHSHSVHVLLEEERPTSGRPRGSHPLLLTPPPLQRHAYATARFVVFVRAGVGWCGAGTLAVALRWGCGRLTECLWGRLRCPGGSQPTNICLGKCPSPSKSSSKNSCAFCALCARHFENNRKSTTSSSK